MITYNLRAQLLEGGKIEAYQLLESHPLYKKYLPRTLFRSHLQFIPLQASNIKNT